MAERAKAKRKTKSSKGNGTGKPRAGHNSGEIPEEVILRWDAKINTAEIAASKVKVLYDSAKGRLQSVYRAAKEDGVDIDALKEARKMDADDHAAVELR